MALQQKQQKQHKENSGMKQILPFCAFMLAVSASAAELARECARTGEPMLRNLAYQFPGCGYEAVVDQFMMGDFLMVAPQQEKGAEERTVLVPPGRWLSDDGKTVDSPCRITVSTPLERLPHFTRQMAK
jgi:alpha-glucosidase (family GH31 glycosyl hydrolase)